MKEQKIKAVGIWSYITAIAIAIMLCGTVVFVSIQHSQTQKDITNTQTQAMKESANKVSEGLSDIGSGICKTSDKQFVSCGY